jgi:LPXTG-site transpeptidase (sortase) family protein
MMSKKAFASMIIACVIFSFSITVTVSADRPPYAFGGGERAVHINENPAWSANEHPVHVGTVQDGYEYGAFLGILTIERLNRSVNIYGGATDDAMSKGAGHFSFTGIHDGNVALIGHNRGSSGFFSFVRLLRYGDIVTLDMGGTVRTYEVFMENIVYDTDFTPLQQFGCNRLSLITCLEGFRNQRRVVAAREVGGIT